MDYDDPTEEEIELCLESQDFTCAACGEDSRGEAGIGDKWYCHRDERSCYMAASHADFYVSDLLGDPDDGWTVAFVDRRSKA